MTAPFFEFGLFGQEVGLLFAFIIGISFGFFLEKGGLGNAKKLAGQFYFTDMTVFKMMFSAIVTALLGLSILSWVGFLDLSLIALSNTYVLPYLVAGLLFGAGFVIGGLCPGTACVSSVTGRIDGIVLLAGVFFGIFLFGETFGSFNKFLYSTSLNHISIPEYSGTSYGLVVFIVVIVALAGFIGAEKKEKKFSSKTITNEENNNQSKSKINVWLGSIAFVFALVVLFAGSPYQESYKIDDGEGISLEEIKAQMIDSEDLAQMIMSRQKDFNIIDLRTPEQYKKYHIPLAVNYSDSLSIFSTNNSNKKIIFYDQGNKTSVTFANKLESESNNQFYFLRGGLNNWVNEILFPNLNIPRGLNPDEIEKAVKRSRYFGGKPKIKSIGNSRGKKYSREGC